MGVVAILFSEQNKFYKFWLLHVYRKKSSCEI